MPRIIVLVFCLLTLSNAPARGQDTTRVQTYSVAGTAAFSLIGTALPIFVGEVLVPHSKRGDTFNDFVKGTLIFTGAIVGPGLGYVHTHNFKRFPRGFGLRYFGAALLTLGEMLEQRNKRPPESTTLYYGGGVLLIGGALYDLIGAPMLVDRQIREAAWREHPRLELSTSGLSVQLRVNL